ncbi:hypothetical protein LCGC14_2883330 [marine sediment metagenome]|uniref:DZANK-type domain-containing protein n=1 Tax=marine sediment metagenome TaxID=412755 RepID=A0A0F8XZQ2_9ZZZZ
MSKRCPNCHVDVIGTKCQDCGFVIGLEWTCPDCGVLLVSVQSPPRFCPVCKDKVDAEKAAAEKVYWDNKSAGLRSISNDIVERILADNAEAK